MTLSAPSPDLYCVMGNPVEHSRSPWIHTRFAELTGQALRYERRLVPLDGFAQALHDFAQAGGRGCNITVPFKLEAAQAATVRSERVLLAGAANTLSWVDGRLHADNTDGLGLLVEQAAEAFRIWRGVRPPSQLVLAELQALMVAPAAH